MTDVLGAVAQALAMLVSLSSSASDIGRIDRAMTDATAERSRMAGVVRLLAVRSTEASPGVLEVPGYDAAASMPDGGGRLPSSLGSAADRFGTPLGYCPARVGSFGSAGNRTGLPGAPGTSTPIAAFVSAGRDRVFQTSCTAALAGASEGDDRVLVEPHHDLLRLRFALAAGIRGKTVDQAQLGCAAAGKLFLPYDPASDTTGCK